jgi:hypothetical protein
MDVATRLAQLGDRIDHASLEERRRATEELVKEIIVQPQTVDGKTIPVITITYRFSEPCQEFVQSQTAVVINHAPASSERLQ